MVQSHDSRNSHPSQGAHQEIDPSKSKLPKSSPYVSIGNGGSLGIEVSHTLTHDGKFVVDFRNSPIPYSYDKTSGFAIFTHTEKFTAKNIVSIAGQTIHNNNPKEISAALSNLKTRNSFTIGVQFEGENGNLETKSYSIKMNPETGYLGALTNGIDKLDSNKQMFSGEGKGLPTTHGQKALAKVSKVTENSPAAVAGLQRGDAIVAYRIDSSSLYVQGSAPKWKAADNSILAKMLRNSHEGDKISFIVRREIGGKIKELVLQATLGGYATRVAGFTKKEINNTTSFKL